MIWCMYKLWNNYQNKYSKHPLPHIVKFFSLCWELLRFTLGNFWRRQWHPSPVLFLPGKSHGRRSLVGYSPWGCEESDTTERLHFDFSLSCIGDGNGNPPHCSCLENPRDGGAWWAARLWGHTESDTTEAMQQQQQQLYCLMVSIKSSLPLLIFRKAKDNWLFINQFLFQWKMKWKSLSHAHLFVTPMDYTVHVIRVDLP